MDAYGGNKQNRAKIKELNTTHELGSRALRTWFEAIGVVPNLAPNAAHAIASRFPSLGCLLSVYLDPSRYVIPFRHYQMYASGLAWR